MTEQLETQQPENTRPARPARRSASRTGGSDTVASLAAEGRVRIVLEENDEIPPTGQYIGLNGVGYLLVPGEPADVPRGVISVLNAAVRDKPITQDGRIVGYRQALRFPYRVVN